MILKVFGGRCRAPSQEPTSAPAPTATSQSGSSAGSEGIVAHTPAKAAAEFNRLNAAEIAADCRVATQPRARTSGARKIPPPTSRDAGDEADRPSCDQGQNERRRFRRLRVGYGGAACRSHHLKSRQQQQEADDRLIDRRRQIRRSPDEREWRPQDRKRVAALPRQQADAIEPHASDRRDQDVERQRRGLDDVGREPEQTHHRDVAGASRLADGRIEDRDRSKGQEETDVPECHLLPAPPAASRRHPSCDRTLSRTAKIHDIACRTAEAARARAAGAKYSALAAD
jgi:hypothetical protein